MNKAFRLLIPVAVVALVAPVLATLSASAAVDTTPPVWRTTVTASAPVGAKLIGPSNPLWCDSDPKDEYSLGVNLDYRATDPESGIDHYEISGTFDSKETTATRTSYTASTYIGHVCGGGSNAISVWAYNGAGLASSGGGYADGTLVVAQDQPSTSVSYSGQWNISNCTCWSDGTTRRSTQKGAAVSYRVGSPLVSNAGRRIDDTPYAVALVMAKGPDRGAADVFVDGAKVASVNTNAPTKLNGTVVWRQAMSPGSHTVRIVNRATAGHPRIDIDAFATFSKQLL